MAKIHSSIIVFFSRLPNILHFFIATLPDFIMDGKISINTQIQNSLTKKKNEFRTIIQLDADIISIIPNPDSFNNENDKSNYEKKCIEHQNKVQEFSTKLDSIGTFIWVISVASSGVLSVGLVPILFKPQNEIILYAINIFFWIVFTFCFRWLIKWWILHNAIRLTQSWFLKLKDKNILSHDSCN